MAGNSAALIGAVTPEPFLAVKGLEGKMIIREDINALKSVWQKTLNF